MTLLIPLLLRLTALFERGGPVDESHSEDQAVSEEIVTIHPEKE